MAYSVFHFHFSYFRDADMQVGRHAGTLSRKSSSFLEVLIMSEEEFYEVVRAEFGSRAVREAKKDIPRFIECLPEDARQDTDEYLNIFQAAWLTAKREARETFTPKKYRYWEQ